METSRWPASIGVVGLGIMGSAFARHLVSAGRHVIGYDVAEARRREAAAAGVLIAPSAAALVAEADLVLTSLPGEAALAATVDDIIVAPRPDRQVLAELSTLSLEGKARQEGRLSALGVAMLDCPVSGTGAQAAARDVVLFVSGDEAAYQRVIPVFAEFARDTVYLGSFGNGTKMKLVANLLVAIHNVAAAEAISLGLSAGLDPGSLVKILASGAGGSRMLELRGPLMVKGVYEPATMKLEVWQKDMQLIAAFAHEIGAATPLFSATAPLYDEALATGRGNQDTAAVYTVLRELSSTQMTQSEAPEA